MTTAGTEVSIPLDVHVPACASPDARRFGEPITVGVPFPRALVRDCGSLGLYDGQSRPTPVQFEVTDRWSDGSVRWTLVDFQANVADGSHQYEIRTGAGWEPGQSDLASQSADGSIRVATGVAVFDFRPGAEFPFAVSVHGRGLLDQTCSAIVIENNRGERLPVVISGVDIEKNGPIRAVIRCDGYVGPRSKPALVITLRLHAFARSAAVRVAITIRNPRKAHHPQGRWPLGGNTSVLLRRAAVRFALRGSAGENLVRCSPEPGAPFESWPVPFELYQDSSGGELWNSPVHLNRDGVIPVSFCGYRVRGGQREEGGRRACPAVTLESGTTTATIAMPQFWQNCPKAIEATSSTLDVALFPSQYADVHELQGGEQKTHVFVVSFAPDAISGGTFDWVRQPLRASVSPNWYAAAEAVRYLTPAAGDPNQDYLRLVSAVVDGDDSAFAKRETVDEFGWRNFGDLWADHEAVFAPGPLPLVSHYNNQYDAVAGFACQFMRTGDSRYWELMDDLARHVVDIDVYHTDEDRAAYNHGLFWHTCHYTDAGTASHRAYPEAPGVAGGGPGNEHDYSTGLMLHHFLTGDPMSRETVIELAGWVLAMDDGGRSWLGWIDRGPTGLASATVSPGYHGPGRGAAYSINTLLDAHRLTREPRYLEKADELVRRCIHPDDDCDALQLLDAERRWSYTVFLQVLARYLDDLAEAGELGARYAYARSALLEYARWMNENERPYLDCPEQLEYPTETWAAQDLRKAAVFALAARHTAGRERERFLERASAFFRYSIATLDAYVTKTLMRPQVLLLTHGFVHAYFDAHPDSTAPAPLHGYEPVPRVAFVPQRARIKQLAVRSIVVGTSAVAALVASLIVFAR